MFLPQYLKTERVRDHDLDAKEAAHMTAREGAPEYSPDNSPYVAAFTIQIKIS
jgi:hypothetical protein